LAVNWRLTSSYGNPSIARVRDSRTVTPIQISRPFPVPATAAVEQDYENDQRYHDVKWVALQAERNDENATRRTGVASRITTPSWMRP
jgi:hypothetical protein